MAKHLKDVLAREGAYRGQGVNHEGQPFTGTLRLSPILGNKGVALEYDAIGLDGTPYHGERSVLGPTLSESLALWVVSSNHPAVVQHELRRVEPMGQDAGLTLVFGFGDPSDRGVFREEIALDLYAAGDVGYRYFWGMPGGAFAERSGVRMGRKTGTGNRPETATESPN